MNATDKESLKKSATKIANLHSVYTVFLIYGWIVPNIRWEMKKPPPKKKVAGMGFGTAKASQY